MADMIQNFHEDQGEFLATQWLSVKQFEEAGITCRKGSFTSQEAEKTQVAIQMYQKENNLSDEQLDAVIHSNGAANRFWSYIARAVPQRGVKAVFYHVRCSCEYLGRAGKWSPAEDEQLQQAVRTQGNNWVAIADIVQHSPADCSDRYCQQIQYKDTRRRGAWTLEEESQLLLAIEESGRKGTSDMSARGFWVSVSKEMGATRTPKQCQNKWSDTFQSKVKNKGKTPCWTGEDSRVLVCKIASLDVSDESDIDWKSLSDPGWNMWSGHYLHHKWRSLKASYNDESIVRHRDVVHRLVMSVCATPKSPIPSTVIMDVPLPSTFCNT